MSECQIEGCDNPVRSRGWCGKHYVRWQKHGDPLKTLPKGRPPAVVVGDRFGDWTVISVASKRGAGGKVRRMYLCECVCGGRREVVGYSLLNGDSTSCGCAGRQRQIESATEHGHNRVGKRSPTYRTWAKMRERCNNPNHEHFHYYGGRGIVVHPSWESFAVFLADMGERPEGKTLDRIDPDGNYEPINCRWATHSEQMRNRRPRTK